MIEVRLTLAECGEGARAGLERRLSAMARNRKDRYGKPNRGYWETDIQSTCSELAVSRYFGVQFDPQIGSLDTIRGDVAGCQVRWTNLPFGRLVLYDEDSDSQPFILVTGEAPVFQLVGWIYGREGKKESYRFKGDGREQPTGRCPFFVPQEVLRNICEVPR